MAESGLAAPSRNSRPFGILAVTAVLVGLAESWQWNYPAVVRTAGELVDLGIVVYTALAVLVEFGYWLMFYAMEKTKAMLRKEREKGREEGRVQGREKGLVEGRQEGLEKGREEGREQGRAEERRTLLEWLEREKGIKLDDFPSD